MFDIFSNETKNMHGRKINTLYISLNDSIKVFDLTYIFIQVEIDMLFKYLSEKGMSDSFVMTAAPKTTGENYV